MYNPPELDEARQQEREGLPRASLRHADQVLLRMIITIIIIIIAIIILIIILIILIIIIIIVIICVF